MTRAVLHVDMDAFYASVEQHDDPRLLGKPLIVGWDGGRGVVAAASYEVRRYGVRSAMPVRTALRLCPQAVCVRPRMQRYQEVSGVVPNKLVAKIASDLMKPDGLTVVTAERVRAVLDPLSVRRLPGLGRKTGERVEAAGIGTFGELRSAPGCHAREARPLGQQGARRAEDTFEHVLGEPRALQAQLARLADVAAARLRTRQLVAGCIGVKIRREDFTTFTRQRAVAPPTCELRAIAGVAAELLGRWLAGNPGAKLRLLGVVLTELTPASQLGLFETAGRPGGLDAALDEARARFGPRALRRGSTIG